MNLKKISSLLALIAVIIYCIFFRNSDVSSNAADLFIIGTVGNYAPFASINTQGEYEGFDIDMAKKLAQKLDKKLIIKDLGSMAPLFIALEQNSIDAIMWGLSITQERLNKVLMIRYAGQDTTSYPLIFWKKIPDGITNIKDMTAMTICVEPASCQEAVLNKYPFINQKFTEKIDDALLNIQYGKADAALVEQAIAQKFKNKYPEIQILDIPLATEDQVKGIGIVVKKDNPELAKKIQDALELLQQEGIIQDLEKKWNIS